MYRDLCPRVYYGILQNVRIEKHMICTLSDNQQVILLVGGRAGVCVYNRADGMYLLVLLEEK